MVNDDGMRWRAAWASADAPLVCSTAAALIWWLSALCGPTVGQATGPTELSGMAWVAGDTFLIAHDAKVVDELDWTRLSLVRLPNSEAGPTWTPLDVAWPKSEGPSHDLEGVARIPGSNTYLVAESGDDGTTYQRIYIAEYDERLEDEPVRVTGAAAWPVTAYNVEAIEVARLENQLIFVFAERAHGKEQTKIGWASVTLDPLTFGSTSTITLPNLDPTGPHSRPVSALAIDSDGRLYTASTMDKDEDGGPFRSVVWEVGILSMSEVGQVSVDLHAQPQRLATLDGFKVESIAVRERQAGVVELFIGTDDEHYGGVVRPLPMSR